MVRTPISISAHRKRPISLVVSFSMLITTITLVIVGWSFVGAKVLEKNATNPLIYKHLRFDQYFLQLQRRYQKHLAIDEKRIKLRVNETNSCPSDRLNNKTKNEQKEVAYSFYENPQVEASNFTYDDLVFEALDRVYHTRLWPAYIYNYDNKEDLQKASDPAKISCSRCEKELNFLMSSLDVVVKSRLESSLHWPLSNALNPELWAFFDAFANEEPGLLLGNSHWTGENWRECHKRSVFNLDTSNPNNSVDFKGRFCLASIRSPRWDSKIPDRIAEMEAYKHFEYSDQRVNYARFFRIQLGICLPESCDSRIYESRSHDILKLATFKLQEPLRSYDLVDLYCLPDETSELRKLEPSGRLFVYCATAWLLIVLAATIHDYKNRYIHSKVEESKPVEAGPRRQLSFWEKIVSIFSLVANFERLFETRSCQPTAPLSARLTDLRSAIIAANTSRAKTHGELPGLSGPKLAPNDLLFLNFLKAFCMTMIILGHSGMLWKQVDRFPNDYDALSLPVANYHFNTLFFVDWFFAMSGFLTAYIMFVTRKPERNSPIDWLYAIVHRYWRLAPLYILIFWYSQSIFMYTSSGPLWDYGSNNMTMRSICRKESWMVPLTLTANFRPIHSECIMPAWSISNDFQYFLLMPFLLILLHKSPMLGWLVSCGSIVVCISLRLHRYLTDVRVKPLELMRPRYDLYMRNNWDMYTTYVLPHYRIASYLIGVLAGHYTYMVLSGKWKSSIHVDPAALVAANQSGRARQAESAFQMEHTIRRAKSRRFTVWLLGVTIAASMTYATWFISTFFPLSLEPHVKYFTAAIYAMHHSIVASAVSMFMVAMMLGQFENLMKFMSWPIWSVIVRFNYPILLTQVEAIYWFAQSADRLTELNDLEYMKSVLYLYAFLYPLGGLLAMLLELPLIQIEKYFINPIFVKKPPAVVSNPDSERHPLSEKSKSSGQ